MFTGSTVHGGAAKCEQIPRKNNTHAIFKNFAIVSLFVLNAEPTTYHGSYSHRKYTSHTRYCKKDEENDFAHIITHTTSDNPRAAKIVISCNEQRDTSEC